MKKLIFSVLILPALLSGCSFYHPIAVSSTGIGGQYERPSGMASGKAARWYFFPCYALCSSGDDSMQAAVADAMSGKTGETLANVFAERKTTVYIPFLLAKSEISVTGTMVKYSGKEFAPDREYAYSASPGEMWAQLLSLGKSERAQYVRRMPDRSRSRLIDFALDRETARTIEEGSRDGEVFELLLLRSPKMVQPKSSLKTESVVNLNDCNSYDCVITLSPEKQAEALRLLSESGNKPARALLVSSAQRRIKACFPDKTPSVVTAPEVQLIYNEEALLENLCKGRELR